MFIRLFLILFLSKTHFHKKGLSLSLVLKVELGNGPFNVFRLFELVLVL